MCTAVSFQSKDHYFGRNLDLHHRFDESVVVSPRNYPFRFQAVDTISEHYAMIGIATVIDNYPLYYDAVNELGLGIAGLNFPGNTVYFPMDARKNNIASFELIPWVLCKCRSVQEACCLLKQTNILDYAFNADLPTTPLHWLIADSKESIVLETTAAGLQLYPDPMGILTNNPPFPYHAQNICNYMNVTSQEPSNRFSKEFPLTKYSFGMGGIGLPGDLSSSSRFVRAAFTKTNSVCQGDEYSSVSQFFHILDAVAQQRGCVRLDEGLERTVYSSCCNTRKGIYYYKTYDNSRITGVKLHSIPLDSEALSLFPLRWQQDILYENE